MFPPGPIALEVIATSLDDARAAEAGGASRLELVAALDRGGLTADLALLDAVLASVRLPVRAIIREAEPHEVPDPASRTRLVAAAREVGRRAVDGIVFGAVSGGAIDVPLLDAVAEAARRPVTFHRAFEAVADPDAALRLLARHPAVDLLLCDGGPGDWPERAERLARWSDLAGEAVAIMPGGGVTEEAVDWLARVPGIRHLHVGRLVREPVSAKGVVSAVKVAKLVARVSDARAGHRFS